MGQVKKAVMEVEDFVSNCIVKNRTLNQTILVRVRQVIHIHLIQLIKVKK